MMLLSAEWEKFLWEAIIFLTFTLICSGLANFRFSKTQNLLAAGFAFVGIALLQVAFLLTSQDATLVLTLLPITAYLPAIIFLHLLSRTVFFRQWLFGQLELLFTL